jgi:hypothetical protein
LERDALDEFDLVLVEVLARLAPDEAEEAERVLADADGGDERRAPAERGVEGEADGLGQRRVDDAQRLRLGQKLRHRGEGRDVYGLAVRLDEFADARGGGVRRGLERREADGLARGLDDAERAVVAADQLVRALKDVRGQLAEVRARVDEVGDLKQRARARGLAPLVRVEPRVLVADRDLARDGLEEGDFFVVPAAHGPRRVEADEAEHVAVEDDRHDEERARAE